MSEVDAAAEAKVVAAVEKRLFIGGQWVDATGGGTFEVVDPSTGSALCSVADATPADGRAALDAAVASTGWSPTSTPTTFAGPFEWLSPSRLEWSGSTKASSPTRRLPSVG